MVAIVARLPAKSDKVCPTEVAVSAVEEVACMNHCPEAFQPFRWRHSHTAGGTSSRIEDS
jgi:hypothetical protein